MHYKNKNLSDDPGVGPAGLETTLGATSFDPTGSTLFSTSEPSSPAYTYEETNDSAPRVVAQAASNASNNQTINNSVNQSA